MSYLLKLAIEIINKVVKVETSIKAEKVVLPACGSKHPYQHPKNFRVLSAAVQQGFDEWAAREVALPERKLYTFKDVYISWHGIIFKNLSLFVPSLMYPALADGFKNRFLFRQWIGDRQALPLDRPLALVFDQWSAVNYFHWIIEAVPKLVVLARECPEATLLLPGNLPDYVTATARIFGFHQFIPVREGVIYSAHSVLWPERLGTFWLQDAGLLRKVRAVILDFYKLTEVAPHRKIYVSRARAKIRRLVNEELLHEVLETNGFEVVFFEGMLFEEQVRLVAEAAVLVGVHGANLTNMLFMAPATKLVELINESNRNLAYYKLAACCSIDYYCLTCQNADAVVSNDSDFLVDVPAFTKLVAQGGA